MLEKTDLLGAIVTVAYFTSTIWIFVLRLIGKSKHGQMLGFLQTILTIPIVGVLLFTAPKLERPTLYFIQVSLMLIFLLLELFIDYILKINFRQVSWMVISYVTFFFAATGGMIGVTANAGRGWTITAVILFLIMALLAFIQRSLTGL